MEKWARRRPALAALLGVLLLALVSLAVLSGNLVAARNDADKKRQAAEQEADKARKARDFLVRIFELSDARTQISTLTPRQILDDAEKRIPRDIVDQPELRAELQSAIDGVYAKITQNAPVAMLLEVRGTMGLQSSRDPRRQPVPRRSRLRPHRAFFLQEVPSVRTILGGLLVLGVAFYSTITADKTHSAPVDRAASRPTPPSSDEVVAYKVRARGNSF
jgi:hypothetical protein